MSSSVSRCWSVSLANRLHIAGYIFASCQALHSKRLFVGQMDVKTSDNIFAVRKCVM
jgi:hypothetical protein